MQGQLFTQDFLTRGVSETPAWQAMSGAAFAGFEATLRATFAELRADSTLNEAQTGIARATTCWPCCRC